MHLITRSCVLFLWMHTLTLVKSQDCTLEQFLKSRLYDSNFDTTGLEASYPGGKQVRVGCNVGYSGFFKLICVEGAWQSRGTKCQPRSCGHPGDAQFADFHLDKGDDFVFGSEVVYTCHKGYQMVSRSNLRRCMAEGWDGVVPICEAQHCPAIHVDSNVFVNGDPDEATYGNVIRFGCKSNTMVMDGLPEIYCDENGKWNGEAPKCKVVKCTIPLIENGHVPGDQQEYNEHEVLHFECKSKYRRTEDRPSKCTKVGLRAEWSPMPLCEQIKCKLQEPLSGTRYQPSSRNLFEPGETVAVTCGETYWISEQHFRSVRTECKEDGQWTIDPVCKEVICTRQDRFVTHWGSYWPPVTLGQSESYRCRDNYKSPDGKNRATCTRYGWSPNPLCQEIICEREDIQNAVITGEDKQVYKNWQTARYRCREGYDGEVVRTCTQSGWTGRSQCRAITCRKQYYENADIEVNNQPEYRYNDKVEYICKNGYEGRFNLTCGARGWMGSNQCTRIQCKKLDIPNAYITRNAKESYNYNERVQYACRNNDANRFTVTCDQRAWTGIQSCSACPEAKIPNGFALGPYDDTVYYTCKEGYKLFTKGWWHEAKCIDGEWSGFKKCIEKSKCGEIPAIPNRKVTSEQIVYDENQSVQIICKDGYRATVDSLTCRQGRWRSEGLILKTICTPIASHCSPPPKVENAVVMTPYQKEYLSDSKVTYECRDRYMMEEEQTLQCKDGKWEEKNIKCTLYCDRLKDERQTMTFIADKERYLEGHVIDYQCISGGVETGKATCVNSSWDKTVECEAPPQEQ